MVTLSETKQTARKSYKCDACETWCNSSYGEKDVSPDDWLIVQACEADNWKIAVGQEYIKVIYVDDGIATYRARIDMHNLCDRLGFFEDY